MAWAYLASMTVIMVANAVASDVSLLVERSQLQEGTQDWDVPLAIMVAILGPIATYLIAGLDMRFEWTSGIEQVRQVVALALVWLGGGLGTWAMASNQYFSATARIQAERDHQVVTLGPYRYVRHPGYLGGILCALATPIALGSWWALIPGVLAASGYVVRTVLEDRMLQEELVGYRAYAEEVRYRVVPGIW